MKIFRSAAKERRENLLRLLESAYGRQCPVCGRPFRADEEVGPVRTCDCGDRTDDREDPPMGLEGEESEWPAELGE